MRKILVIALALSAAILSAQEFKAGSPEMCIRDSYSLLMSTGS